jgi:hypothetical protein
VIQKGASSFDDALLYIYFFAPNLTMRPFFVCISIGRIIQIIEIVSIKSARNSITAPLDLN